MTDLLLRVGLAAAILTAAFLIATMVQRRTGAGRYLDLPPGLVVVTGPDCRWCDRLETALTQRPDLRYRLLDHAEAAARGLAVRSLPTALVLANDGTVTMRRSGPSALHDVDALISQLDR
jgi:hypothetical protein